MKNRKHLIHNALVGEVTRQLATRFHPNPNDIKKQIEYLIDVSLTWFLYCCFTDQPTAGILGTLRGSQVI
jgi:hypothetical protein